MRRLLLDANMPRGLRAVLTSYQVETAHQRGWATPTNGDLLIAAEAEGFDMMLTADRNALEAGGEPHVNKVPAASASSETH